MIPAMPNTVRVSLTSASAVSANVAFVVKVANEKQLIFLDLVAFI